MEFTEVRINNKRLFNWFFLTKKKNNQQLTAKEEPNVAKRKGDYND